MVVSNDSDVKIRVYHDDEPVDNFTIEADSDKNSSVVQVLLKEIENKDEGIYSISVEYKRQKYVHKIGVSVGKYSCLSNILESCQNSRELLFKFIKFGRINKQKIKNLI